MSPHLLPAARWGVTAPLQPLPGGHRNLAFRTTGLPQDIVFKSTRRSAQALDWDECRRDLVLFDLEPLLPAKAAQARARLAWEVACSWQVEPDYARQLAIGLCL